MPEFKTIGKVASKLQLEVIGFASHEIVQPTSIIASAYNVPMLYIYIYIVLTEIFGHSSGTAHMSTTSERAYQSGQSFLRDI